MDDCDRSRPTTADKFRWTWSELCGRYDQIRRFEVNLPEMLPQAQWPSKPGSVTVPTESDLLFAHLFLLRALRPLSPGEDSTTTASSDLTTPVVSTFVCEISGEGLELTEA